ncbi:hypothetical protein Tsubulata_002670 [Turnera subulata]|uniref:MalT-like TPR region domain-containing protein n=1 Tax=Turnera subulata TaxID=218843 RepID=A0A9Q0F5H4_9ROSI|nr:hypothetical protein Tsubulata_002670 [Turnera subulata]
MALTTADVALQLAILLFTLGIFLAIHCISKHPRTQHHRPKNRTTLQANRHILQATHLLSRAKSLPRGGGSQSQASLAKTALAEAETAISLSPKDPAPLLLRALALDLLGHTASALKSIDSALSFPRGKLLSQKDRADALVKRAELKLAVNRRRRVDSAIQDLKQAVELLAKCSSATADGGDTTRPLCLLGQCYESKGMTDEAKWAFGEALRLRPGSVMARRGLDRLGS